MPPAPLVVYFFLLLLVRLSGKRTLAQVTTFDFVLLLIIGEATQQGLIGDDFSVTKALLLITTLLGIDIGLSLNQGSLATTCALSRRGSSCRRKGW